jgi:hypothetical protein
MRVAGMLIFRILLQTVCLLFLTSSRWNEIRHSYFEMHRCMRALASRKNRFAQKQFALSVSRWRRYQDGFGGIEPRPALPNAERTLRKGYEAEGRGRPGRKNG